MEFCEACDNLLYLRTDDNVSLVKYCKHCTFVKREEDHTTTGNRKRAIKVTESLYSDDDLLYLQFQNKYLRFDPTLPRVNDPAIVCPNTECSRPQSGELKNQVLYVKYHPVHMKYLYCCDYCGTTWRS